MNTFLHKACTRLALLTAVFVFFACDTADSAHGRLAGTWRLRYSADGMTVISISDTAFHYYDPAYPAFDAVGRVVYHTDYARAYGVIIFRLTAGAHRGAYTAAYWRDLTETSALIATAYKDNDAEYAATLDTARAVFTLFNDGEWVTWTVVQPYTKD